MTATGPGYTGRFQVWMWSVKWKILLNVCVYIFLLESLLKKVTKEHLKDDFDSLFKHLSSDQKTVSKLGLLLLCPCLVTVEQTHRSFSHIKSNVTFLFSIFFGSCTCLKDVIVYSGIWRWHEKFDVLWFSQSRRGKLGNLTYLICNYQQAKGRNCIALR